MQINKTSRRWFKNLALMQIYNALKYISASIFINDSIMFICDPSICTIFTIKIFYISSKAQNFLYWKATLKQIVRYYQWSISIRLRFQASLMNLFQAQLQMSNFWWSPLLLCYQALLFLKMNSALIDAHFNIFINLQVNF